jgi:hypothetical protein
MKNSKKLVIEYLKTELSKQGDSFRHSPIYKLLKEELTTKGNWKAAPRGNPKKGFQAMKDRQI